MRFLLLLTLLPLLAAYHQDVNDFQCKRGDDGSLLCSFKVPPDGTKTLELSDCFGDDCVEAQIAVTKLSTTTTTVDDSASIHNANDELKITEARDRLATDTAAHTDDGRVPKNNGNEYPVTVAGQTFRVPWSQYGVLVEGALHQSHGRNDWEYGGWLITLAVAVRGGAQDGLNPQIVDQVVQILKVAVEIFAKLEMNGFGDAKVSMGNAHMTIAESYIYDSFNPQYSQALKHFDLSKQLFKSALAMNENKLPIGMTRADVELNWADTLVRIAVLTIEEKMVAAQMTELNLDSLAMGGIGSDMAQMGETTTRAEALLIDAIGVFRRKVDTPSSVLITAAQRSTRLANALQNLASISMLITPQLEKSNALLEEAVTHYERALEFGLNDDPERENAIAGGATSLYSLADGYLQEGKYEQSKARYRDTMIWYERHNLASLMAQDVQFADVDESLDATEQALEDYNVMLYGGGEIPIPNDHGDPMYQADERYEADLHATLGALRMARNEMHLAMNHFASAIERYARNPESAGRALGDARLNLAMAYFKQGEYALSTEARADALDVYQKVVGEGKNPLMDELETLLAQHGIDRETVPPGDEGAADGTKGGESSDRLIDLSAYQASILNATARDEL